LSSLLLEDEQDSPQFKYPKSEFPIKTFKTSDLDPSNLSSKLQDSTPDLESDQKITHLKKKLEQAQIEAAEKDKEKEFMEKIAI